MKPELFDYLKSQAKKSFDIEANNCIQFTNKCWEIEYGFPYSKEYASASTIEEVGFTDPLESADAVLERSERPQSGHLVAMRVPGVTHLAGYITGYCVGDLCVFLGDRGLKYLPTKLIKYSWKNKDANI